MGVTEHPDITAPTPVAIRGRDGGSAAEMGEPNLANTLRAGDGGSSRSQLIALPASFAENQRGEIVTSGLSPASGEGGGKPGMGYSATFFETPSGVRVRRLTPMECERLMGWPDNHTKYTADGTQIADTHRYRMCGNGVVAPVAQWIAECIARVS